MNLVAVVFGCEDDDGPMGTNNISKCVKRVEVDGLDIEREMR